MSHAVKALRRLPDMQDASVKVDVVPPQSKKLSGRTDDYHVFLTPRGASWFYVESQSSDDGSGGSSNIAFSYRLVARRGDIPGVRLEHVQEPAAPNCPLSRRPQSRRRRRSCRKAAAIAEATR